MSSLVYTAPAKTAYIWNLDYTINQSHWPLNSIRNISGLFSEGKAFWD